MERGLEEKLRELLKSDPAAAAWLYDTFAPRIYRRLRQRYSYLEDPDVEDLLHDTFLLSFQNGFRVFERFLESDASTDEETLERRLWDLACGLAANLRRSAAVRRVVPLAERHNPVSSAHAEQAVMDRDLLSRLNACLEERSTRVFLYFQLRYRDGLSPQEVSQVTGWSQKATYKLKQRLDEAIRRCAQKLEIA